MRINRINLNKYLLNIFLILALNLFIVTISFASSWYVDNAASGSNDGTSWTNAWESFADIVWGGSGVTAGDTLYISGGSISKTYNEKLNVGASGTSGSPITIKVGQIAGHNGTVTITVSSDYGIALFGDSYITIDGSYNNEQRIRVTGCGMSGIALGNVAHHNALTYLEIDNNGDAKNEDGITASYSNMDSSQSPVLEVSHSKIHDNWQDQIHITGSLGAAKYDRVLIHDNEIYNCPDDCVETAFHGVSMYNNSVHHIITGKGTGHPDGLVIMSSYGKLYNNLVYDFYNANAVTNAYLYINLYSGASPRDDCCIRVYNNLLYQTEDPNGDYARGIEFAPQDTITSVSDILIANNTIVGLTAWGALLNFRSGAAALDTDQVNDVYFINNIIHNCYRRSGGKAAMSIGSTGSGNFTVGSYGDNVDVVVDYNIISAGIDGATNIPYKGNWWNYDTFKANTDAQDNIDGNPDPLLNSFYKLTDNSPARNTGFALSTYFTTDKLGIIRGFIWDIGTYEYDSKKPNPPTNLRKL